MPGIRSARSGLLVAGVTAALGAVVLRRFTPARVEVQGTSMIPTLQPGDRLLVRRGGRLDAGDLVSLPDPRDPSRALVKRVHAVLGADLDVRGDNPAASTDSRTFGAVPSRVVTGRVVYRYYPPSRSGRIGRWPQGSGRS